jgi:hypothetical protein
MFRFYGNFVNAGFWRPGEMRSFLLKPSPKGTSAGSRINKDG